MRYSWSTESDMDVGIDPTPHPTVLTWTAGTDPAYCLARIKLHTVEAIMLDLFHLLTTKSFF